MDFTVTYSFVCLILSGFSLKFAFGLQLSTDQEHSFTILSGTRTVQFTCSATTTVPPVIYRWYFKRFPMDVQIELTSNSHQTIVDNTMTIDQLRKTDRGIYFIGATDGAGQRSNCTFILQVAYPPVFTSSMPAEKTASDEIRTVITCPVTGFPEPTISWLKDSMPLTTGTTYEINGTDIIFSVATKFDEGLYQCNATNHYGSVISSPVRLTVIEEVVFVSAPQSVVYLHEGDPAVFLCNATGHPPPQLEWHKTFFPEDPVTFYTNSTHPVVTVNTGPDYAWSELSFTSVQMSDHGLYECRANQLSTVSKSRLFEVVIYARPAITSLHSSEVTVLLGNPYTFICNATGFPKPELTWYKNGLEVMTNSRFVMAPGVLHIIRTEGPDSGVYSCHASNSVGQVDSSQTNFFVQGLYFTKQPPALVHLNLGDSITFNCSAAGSQYAIVIEWFKNSVKIRDTCASPDSGNCHLFTNGSDLHIVNIKKKDIANYTCVAKERGMVLEPHTIRTKTQLLILQAPRFEKLIPETIEGSYQGQLVIECKVSGVPQPSVHWFRDGFEVSNDNHRKVSGGNLTFLRVDSNDRGLYICVAENKVGEIRQQTNITVLTPPKALKVSIAEGFSYAVIKWQVLDDGGHEPSTLRMQLREVSPRLTPWVAISANISGTEGNYILHGLDYTASYELNVWATNDIGDGEVTTHTFNTTSPDEAYEPYDKPDTSGSEEEGSVILIMVCVIVVILIAFTVIVILVVTKFRSPNGDSDDGQSLVNNLHESVSSHSNPVYNMDNQGAAAAANGLEMHDVGLNGDTPK
ncbi:Hemicentin-1 [Holothuria leucospilota]|uniref:Hemicentin-1 n=1 Tax=Holothuria leucospilota TaxID=206669 RepID=A0A9Q1BXP5_HOLLE|nr:Hemicentin-1 [Holothuria leucospilota]